MRGRTGSAVAGTIGPGGFEPPFADPKSAVLPLDEGPARGKVKHCKQREKGGKWTRDPAHALFEVSGARRVSRPAVTSITRSVLPSQHHPASSRSRSESVDREECRSGAGHPAEQGPGARQRLEGLLRSSGAGRRRADSKSLPAIRAMSPQPRARRGRAPSAPRRLASRGLIDPAVGFRGRDPHGRHEQQGRRGGKRRQPEQPLAVAPAEGQRALRSGRKERRCRAGRRTGAARAAARRCPPAGWSRSSAAAASLDPPPSPACTGMRLSSVRCTPNRRPVASSTSSRGPHGQVRHPAGRGRRPAPRSSRRGPPAARPPARRPGPAGRRASRARGSPIPRAPGPAGRG